jgi:uncharacterized protein YyaL (SSP411 family)
MGDSKYPAILQGKTMINNLPTIYVCEDKVCKSPTTRLEESQKLIRIYGAR